MLETTFTTEFKQGPIPAGFFIRLEGSYIAVISPNASGKTSFLNVLFRRNVGTKKEGKTQICLIQPAMTFDTALPNGRTLEQYNIELAKIIEENNGRGQQRYGPRPREVPKLLLTHNNFTVQVQKLNSYLEYLGLPKCEIQGTQEDILEQLQNISLKSGLQSILAILAALTDDYIKMVLIDEPEVYLHPKLQKQLRELFYGASKEKQIIITTHSNMFINRKDYSSNYFISRDNNQFSISRAYSEAQFEGISSAEIKLVKALAKAVPSIAPNLLTSLDIEELYVEQPEDTSPITKIVQEKREEINITVFYEELKETIKHNKDELATRHKERVQQTNIAYYISLICLILGLLLVFTGAILIFIGKLEGGVLTIVSSTISSIVSGLAFVFNKQANDLEREDSKQMRTLEKSYEAMGYISCMTDKKKRDELIEKLVQKHFFEN